MRLVPGTTALLLAGFLTRALAADQLVLNTPVSVTQCNPTLLTWSGGESPYTISIQAGGTVFLSQDRLTSSDVLWNANVAAGTKVTLFVTDQTGQKSTGSPFTVIASTSSCFIFAGDTSTVGTPFSAATSSASPTAVSSASQNATSTPSASSVVSASASISASVSSNSSSALISASTIDPPSSSKSRSGAGSKLSSLATGLIVVAVVAIVATSALLFRCIWRRRRLKDAEGGHEPPVDAQGYQPAPSVPFSASESETSVAGTEKRLLGLPSSSSPSLGLQSSSSEVVLVGPDPEREIVRAQQERMLEKVTGRRLSPRADGTPDAGSSSTFPSRPWPEDDGEREVLRAQVSMLQRQMEEMRVNQGIPADVEEVLPPAYEGSTSGRI